MEVLGRAALWGFAPMPRPARIAAARSGGVRRLEMLVRPSSSGASDVGAGVRAAAAKGRGGGKASKAKDGAAKKKPKKTTNVWSSDFAPGDERQRSSESASQESGFAAKIGDGGRRRRRQREMPGAEQANEIGQEVEVDTYLRFLSPVLPIEEEILLQPEETVANPLWGTFCSSSSGVWRGVGATFSPVTGDFEPISLDRNGQYVYDTRIVTTVETIRTSEEGQALALEQQCMHRTVLWSAEKPVTLDVEEAVETAQEDGADSEAEVSSFTLQDADDVDMGYWEDDEDEGEDSEWEYVLADPGDADERWANGEELEVMDEFEDMDDGDDDSEDGAEWTSEVLDGDWEGQSVSSGENEINLSGEDQTSTDNGQSSTSSVAPKSSYSSDLPSGTTCTDVMEQDDMMWEAGLVFFEDGAYSRGPLELNTVASASDLGNLSYACKIEQCLVAGGHGRLRVVHTVSVEGGEKLEVLRVAVYEEEWMGPCNMKAISDAGGHHLKLFTERARHHPGEIVGTWKVFNVEGMAIHPSKSAPNQTGSFLFSCKETSIKRGYPVLPKLTVQDDGSVDMSDFSMSWLTGNVSAYVSVNENNGLTFGVGWMCENRTRLVMERVYDEDGKLMHVNSKSEIKLAESR